MGKCAAGVNDGNGFGHKNVEEELLEFCHEEDLCEANTWFWKEDK